MFNTEQLQEKWAPVLSHGDLPEIMHFDPSGGLVDRGLQFQKTVFLLRIFLVLFLLLLLVLLFVVRS